MKKVNKKEILTALKVDFKAAETHQSEWIAQIAEWKSQTLGAPYGNEVDGKSQIVSKDISKQISWMLPSLADPFLSSQDVVKCNPITANDTKRSEQSELLLNTYFCRKFPRHNFIMKALKVLTTEGTVVIKTGWEYEDEEIEIETEQAVVDGYGNQFVELSKVKDVNILKNQPTAEVCRNEDIFIDPTCMDDIDQCQFIVHRYETDLSTLRTDGRYKNLDKVAESNASTDNDGDGYTTADKSAFKFADEPRKKMVVYEYWGYYDVDGDGEVESIVCAWVGNNIIRLETNPYPDKKPPFIIVPFNSVPFQMFGEALAEIIGDNQKVKTAITRGIIDNMAKSNNGQVGFARGALDESNRRKFLQGRNFEYSGTMSGFWQGSYNQIPGSAFDMLSMQNNEIESQTGTKSFSGGINGNALGDSATGARGALDATSVRRIALVRNISENMLKPMMRKWLAYFAEFMEPEEIVRITELEFVPVMKDDIGGNLDIEITIATAEDNAARSSQYSFLLQTIGNNMPLEMTQKIMARIAKLARDPELEKEVREYKQQPDPAAEQMKQIQLERAQLENEQLRASIERDKARAFEDQVDAKVKLAKIEVELAKAKKLRSEGDKLDLDFVMADEQVDAEERMSDREMKLREAELKLALQRDMKQADRDHAASEKDKDRMLQVALVRYQAEHGDKNIGIGA